MALSVASSQEVVVLASLPAGSSNSELEVNELPHSPPPSVTLGMESESSSLALASYDSEVELFEAEVRDGDSAALSGVIGGGPPAKKS